MFLLKTQLSINLLHTLLTIPKFVVSFLHQNLSVPLFVLLIAEILNSAVEKCVDLVSPNFQPLAKFAKDAGSAAVFIALANIAVCWIVVFVF